MFLRQFTTNQNQSFGSRSAFLTQIDQSHKKTDLYDNIEIERLPLRSMHEHEPMR
jgi:hypothetical protein